MYCSVSGDGLAGWGTGSGSPARGSPRAGSLTPCEPAAREPDAVVVSVELISRRSLRPSLASTSIEAVTSLSSTRPASFTRGAAPISCAAVGQVAVQLDALLGGEEVVVLARLVLLDRIRVGEQAERAEVDRVGAAAVAVAGGRAVAEPVRVARAPHPRDRAGGELPLLVQPEDPELARLGAGAGQAPRLGVLGGHEHVRAQRQQHRGGGEKAHGLAVHGRSPLVWWCLAVPVDARAGAGGRRSRLPGLPRTDAPAIAASSTTPST